MLALVAAILLALDALRDGLQATDLFVLGLACWALHFAFALAVPWPRR